MYVYKFQSQVDTMAQASGSFTSVPPFFLLPTALGKEKFQILKNSCEPSSFPGVQVNSGIYLAFKGLCRPGWKQSSLPETRLELDQFLGAL